MWNFKTRQSCKDRKCLKLPSTEDFGGNIEWLQMKTEIIFEWWKYFKIDYGDFCNYYTKINEYCTLDEFFFFKTFLQKYLLMGFNKL